MALSCDFYPINVWTIPWNSFGPYYVDSWDTSFHKLDGSLLKAYRVVGKHGNQLHTNDGAVIQFSEDYANNICDAANSGVLIRDSEPKYKR